MIFSSVSSHRHSPSTFLVIASDMEIPIFADVQVAISSEGFAKAWNEHADCSKLAVASTVEQEAEVYDGGLTILLSVLGGVAIGVASNAIYDLLRDLVPDLGKEKSQELDVKIVKSPDGTETIHIRMKSDA